MCVCVCVCCQKFLLVAKFQKKFCTPKLNTTLACGFNLAYISLLLSPIGFLL